LRKIERALVLAPHTDDAELGCGGLIAKLVEEGAAVSVAAFSIARESLPEGYPEDTLSREFAASMQVFGIDETRRLLFDYPVRRFSVNRQEILEDMIRIRSDVDPELVLVPASTDVHQDHQVIHEEGVRAFKHRTVWGYEMPWNQIAFSSQAIVRLSREHVTCKWQALQCYESQVVKGTRYFERGYAESLAKIRGGQVGAEYAEAFEVIRECW